MPHAAGATLLRGGPAAFFTQRRPARSGPTRLARAAAAEPSAAPQVRVEKHGDGSVVYRFDEEQPAAEAVRASPAAVASVAAAPAPPKLAAVLDAAAAAAAAQPAPVQVQQAATMQAAPMAAVASSSSGSSGGVAVLDGVPTPAAFLPPVAAVPPLQQLLHQANGSSSSGSGSGSEGDDAAAGSRNGSATRNGSSRSGGAAGSSDGARPRALQQSRQQPGAGRQQRGSLNGAVPAPKQQPGGRRPASQRYAAPADARSIDYQITEAHVIVGAYDALCEDSDLDEALHLVKECIRAGRADVLAKLRHYRFLRPAASRKAVKQALRFVQLLPRQYVDARTYNMLLRVCARAGDLRNALHVADMLQAAGLKMDTLLYTTLISACAGAGDAEKAFQLYGEMRATGVPCDKMVYASVVKACAQHISRLPLSERRQQLVLLERAFQLVEDAKAARVPTDAAVWNALVTAAGRAGQLQRAFNVLEEMLLANTRPNDRTYASLIDACARAGDKELALRVYRKAQREGCATSLMVYSGAVHACVQASGGCDTETAMAVYADLQRNGVEPDNQLYGMLIKAAGAAGDVDLALGLHDEMQREGLRPCTGTQSALMAVFIRHNKLSEAQYLFKQLRVDGAWPQAYALNALLNAYANNFRLGDVVSLVCEMAEGGMRPDAFTFSAILNACQRADEAELALEVARLMKMRGVRLDEACTVMLLRICYNRLRQAWVPGGYPPNRPATAATAGGTLPGSKRSNERLRLVEALTPRGQQEAEPREQGEVAWLSQAFGVYREAVAAGVKPSMRMLNRILMCLRVAWEGKQAAPEGADVTGEALMPHHSPFTHPGVAQLAGVPRQEKIGVEAVYHVQAVSILEEAILSNVVPPFKLDSDQPVDLRGMPPAVAEVYVLTVLSALQRLCEARRVVTTNVVFLVPSYDGAKVFMPSHLSHVDYERIEAAVGLSSGSDSEAESEEEGSEEEAFGGNFDETDAAYARAAASAEALDADERTGLGVAGVLRRLRLWAREYGERGFILLEAKELTRWCKITQRAAERRSANALPVQKPYGQQLPGQSLPGRSGLQAQQHQIRSNDW